MLNRQQDFLKYRALHPTFCYEKFSYSITNQSINIQFEFILEGNKSEGIADTCFQPTFSIALNKIQNKAKLEQQSLENLIFHMGMVELISYWKAACPAKIIIKAFQLNEEQIQFWKILYWNGLGEFFYINGIETSLDDFMDIQIESDKSLQPLPFQSLDKIIVPIGGGKDSVVSLEILKESSLEIYPFIINPREASLNTINQAEINKRELLSAQRTIDTTLIDLNKKGYLNGHTPFSAMLAFSSLLQAYLIDAKYIALSNESSANEPSVAGSHVNHQYSKSFEFESDFRAYYKTYISSSFEYFSFLRPLSELQIACLFSKFKAHHFSFRSCNVGSKTDTWCCDCPKCLFTYIMLAPFIPEPTLNSMIGENLISKSSLKESMKALRGLTSVKPFECVGTIEEVNLALYQAFEHNNYLKPQDLHFSNPSIKEYDFISALKDWNKEHFLPLFLEDLLKNKLTGC